MAKNTSISLGSHFEKFISRQVRGGRYGTASEVVRAGLRALEQEEARLEAVRSSLTEGERSGFVEDYSIEDVLTDARRKKKS